MEEFISTYWEQQPLHIHRKNGSTQTFVDLQTIENLLSSQPVFFPGVQLTQSGKAIDVASYADDQNRILPLRLYEHYSHGATIVISQAQKLFPSINELCRDVMRTMKMRCQANLYLSPPGNQGFNAHYDTHDVFILQVSGAKTFNFYPSSVKLPCPDENFDSRKLGDTVADESIDLVAGDTLYIPRGVVHDAVADDAAPSIHITVGVYPVLMRDMLHEAIRLLSHRDSRFRQAVDSFSLLPTDNQPDTLQETLISLVNDVGSCLDDPDTVQLLQSRFHDELALEALQDCAGLFDKHNAGFTPAGQLPEFNSIRVRKHMLINYERTADGVKIRTFGQLLEFSDPIGRVVEKLLESGELSISDLDDLQLTQRDAMIRRLLQENLVELHAIKS